MKCRFFDRLNITINLLIFIILMPQFVLAQGFRHELRVDRSEGDCWYPDLASYGSQDVSVVWADTRNLPEGAIVCNGSSTAGLSFFDNDFLVASDPNFASQPGIAADAQGNYHIVWTGSENRVNKIFYCNLVNGVFSDPVRVDHTAAAAMAFCPSIGVDAQGMIYVVFAGLVNGSWNIYLSKSSDHGQSFGEQDIQVDHGGSARSIYPAISVDEKKGINIAWFDDRIDGLLYVFFNRSIDGGLTFNEQDSQVSHAGLQEYAPNVPYFPSIAATMTPTNKAIFVVWGDNRNGMGDIYMAKSTDGVNFGDEDILVEDKGEYSLFPDIALSYRSSQLLLAVTWMYYLNLNSNPKIYCAFSENGGSSFGNEIVVNRYNSPCWYPAITLGTDFQFEPYNTYITWMEKRDPESWNIYMSRTVPVGIIKWVPDKQVVKVGETLYIDTSLRNFTSVNQECYGGVYIYLPNGKPYSKNPLYPTKLTIKPGKTVTAKLKIKVPENTPPAYMGNCRIVARIFSDPQSTELPFDEAEFTVLVSPK